MVAASCGGPRPIESRRCSSTTCAANGSRGRGSRRGDSVVRAGRGEPPEQAPVSARPGPVGGVGPGRAALMKWRGSRPISLRRRPERPSAVGPRSTPPAFGHRVGRLPCVTNLGLLLPRGGRPPGGGILPGDELLVDPLVQRIGRPGARNLLGDDDDVGLPRRCLPGRRRQGRHLRVYYGHGFLSGPWAVPARCVGEHIIIARIVSFVPQGVGKVDGRLSDLRGIWRVGAGAARPRRDDGWCL